MRVAAVNKFFSSDNYLVKCTYYKSFARTWSGISVSVCQRSRSVQASGQEEKEVQGQTHQFIWQEGLTKSQESMHRLHLQVDLHRGESMFRGGSNACKEQCKN